MPLKKLLKNLTKLKNKKILIVGDVMLDEYHWCTVSRISPESPVPVCQVERTTLVPGGAANVSYNLFELGVTPLLMGVVGQDSSGDRLLRIFREKGISTDYLLQSEEKPTILKSRIVAHQQHVVRVDREDTSPLTRKTINRLNKALDEVLPQVQAVIISDYAKGTLSQTFIQCIIKRAKALGLPIVVDPKGDHYLRYKGATLLTPNFSEFKAVTKKSPKTENEVKKLAKSLIKKLKIKGLLVTRSEKGMSLIMGNEKHDISTRAKEVYDITGAGDTVISVLSAALASGFEPLEATELANYAAGIVVGKVGTATTSLEEIQTVLERQISDA